jgi:hypothetical protein
MTAFEFRVPALTAEQRTAIQRRMTTANYRDHCLDDGVLRFVCEPVDLKRMHQLLRSFCKTTGIQKARYQRGVLVTNSIHEYAGKGVSEDLASLVKTSVGKWVSAGSQAAQRYAKGLRRFESLPNRWCQQLFFQAWKQHPAIVRRHRLQRIEKQLGTVRHFSLQCLVIRAFQAFYQNYSDEKSDRLNVWSNGSKIRRLTKGTFPLALQLATNHCLTIEQMMDLHGRGKLTPAGPDPAKLFVGRKIRPTDYIQEDLQWADLRLECPLKFQK